MILIELTPYLTLSSQLLRWIRIRHPWRSLAFACHRLAPARWLATKGKNQDARRPIYYRPAARSEKRPRGTHFVRLFARQKDRVYLKAALEHLQKDRAEQNDEDRRKNKADEGQQQFGGRLVGQSFCALKTLHAQLIGLDS